MLSLKTKLWLKKVGGGGGGGVGSQASMDDSGMFRVSRKSTDTPTWGG